MKRICSIICLLICALIVAPQVFAKGETTRKERKLILQGNKLYKEKKYDAAAVKYKEALKERNGSDEAKYNLGCTFLQRGASTQMDEQKRDSIAMQGVEIMEQIAKLGANKPMLASKASYNIGNFAFNHNKLPEAIQAYKQALRLNPNDNDARRNLRIAQLRQQKNNQDNNQDKNKDKDKDKDKDQNKDQNKDKDKDKNDQNNQQQQNPQRMNPDAAKQILQAVENKENQTRARLNKQNTSSNSSRIKKW